MEREKLLNGSPFTATGVLATGPSDFSRVRLVASGAPCRVILYDTDPAGNVEMITLDALVGAPDEYDGAANRKLPFPNGASCAFTGPGKLYVYYT